MFSYVAQHYTPAITEVIQRLVMTSTQVILVIIFSS